MKKTILLSLGLIGIANVAKAEKPNIIFILADDLGYGDVSCFNENKLVHTPNIDKLAEKGIMMTQAYAYPVSAPTRAAFLTGSQGHEIGVYGNGDSDVPGIGVERKTFTPELQELGYSTAWFGKWHQGYDIASHPKNNGFDRTYGFLGGMHDFQSPREGSFYNGGPYSQYSFIYDNFSPVKDMKYLTEELTDQAISFIKKEKNNPFYIYLAYNAPHTPLQAPEDVVLKYLKQGHEAIAATRYAMIDVMDSQIGRIMSLLKDQKIDKNTLVIFMSDNGPELELNSGGYRGHKFTIWEGGIRSPLIASFPGVIPEGVTSNSMCGVYDMATTFLTAAAAKPTTFGSGVDLMPYFKLEKTDNVRDEFIIANNPGKANIPYNNSNMGLLMVRSNQWKYVRDRQRNELALYDIENDPGERNNVYDKHPEIIEKLLKIADEKLKPCPESSARNFNKDLSTKRANEHINSYKNY